MSIAAKRRETEVFSLSFLDCICCGFGAVLLVFLLTISTKTSVDKSVVDEVRDKLVKTEKQRDEKKQELDRMAKVIAAAQLELQEITSKTKSDQQRLSERRKDLLLMLQQTGAMKDALDRLLAEKAAMPTQEEPAPIPIPEVDRRQYLTGVKLSGEFVVFLVRTSGSMLGDTIDEAVQRLAEPDDKKREAPKWKRTIHALEWLLATLDPETHYQILFFNEETTPIIPTRGEEWFTTKDRTTTAEVLKRLNEVVPKGGANLERAFTAVRFLPRLPDSIVLLTDGLPTRSDSLPVEGDVDEGYRIRFFEIAQKQLPPRIPVSTILFPLLSGDPGAPGLYWELANATRGALVSPSKNWPDT
jgi:hypothetical protein